MIFNYGNAYDLSLMRMAMLGNDTYLLVCVCMIVSVIYEV